MLEGLSHYSWTIQWICQWADPKCRTLLFFTNLTWSQITAFEDRYPLVNIHIAIENGLFIVDLPIKNGDLPKYHSYVNVYQRLPQSYCHYSNDSPLSAPAPARPNCFCTYMPRSTSSTWTTQKQKQLRIETENCVPVYSHIQPANTAETSNIIKLHIYMHIYIYIYMYEYMYMYTHTDTHTCALSPLFWWWQS